MPASNPPPQQPPPTAKPSRGGRFGLLGKLGILGVTLALSLLAAELVARVVGGYALTQIPLVRTEKYYEPPPATPQEVAAALENADPVTAGFLKGLPAARPDLRGEWFHESPAFRPRQKVPAPMQARGDATGVAAANYLFNQEALDILLAVRERWEAMFPKGPPTSMQTFAAGRTGPYPAYRYPPSVTLPSGLVLNRFGWRSEDLELRKPENTLRIACLGASTTVGDHALPYSYPELLGHWLRLWLAAQASDLRIEVINAGREAIRSTDIAAVFLHEVLPFAPDVVIYYEGSNQFDPAPLVEVSAHGMAKPPRLPRANESFAGLAKYSALLKITGGVLQSSTKIPEPAKPEQRFVLPPGVQELQPDSQQANFLSLQTILRDVESVREACVAGGIQFALCSFVWFTPEEQDLNAHQHHGIYGMLNDRLWPLRYGNIARAAALQNRVYRDYAKKHQVPFLDVAARMPKDPDLFLDPLHNTSLGTRIRAWAVFEALTPILAKALAGGTLPNPPRTPPETLEFLAPPTRISLDAPR